MSYFYEFVNGDVYGSRKLITTPTLLSHCVILRARHGYTDSRLVRLTGVK